MQPSTTERQGTYQRFRSHGEGPMGVSVTNRATRKAEGGSYLCRRYVLCPNGRDREPVHQEGLASFR